MKNIRKILVAVKQLDAKSLPAVLKAAQVARACGAELELFHALTTPLHADSYLYAERSIEQAQSAIRENALHRLENIADRLRQHTIRISVAAEWDFPPHEAIVRRAIRSKADLIVAHRYAGRHAAAALLTLTDWELIRNSPVPVLLVRDPHAYRHPAMLAAVDPAHVHAKPLQLDKAILGIARKLSTDLRGTLHAVHAYPGVNTLSFPPEMPVSQEVIDTIERGTKRSAGVRFVRELRPFRVARARQYLISGPPRQAISQAAQRCRSAIVVMGAISRSGLKRFFIGNTAEGVLDELRCDVLIVKPAAFKERLSRAVRGPRILPSQSVYF